jgi:fucose permease
MILSSTISIGQLFCFDIPSALQTQLMSRFDINSFYYNLFYSVYSLPNIVLPICGGLFIDKVGIRSGLLLCLFTVVVG